MTHDVEQLLYSKTTKNAYVRHHFNTYYIVTMKFNLYLKNENVENIIARSSVLSIVLVLIVVQTVYDENTCDV